MKNHLTALTPRPAFWTRVFWFTVPDRGAIAVVLNRLLRRKTGRVDTTHETLEFLK